MGKVPAIEVDGFSMWESGAILLYLQDKYGEPLTPEQRGTVAQWVLFANATLGPGLFIEATREKEGPRLLGGLNQALEGRTFLLGDTFSAADVAVGSMVAYMTLMLKMELSSYPHVAAYVKHLSERPAYQKGIAIPIPA
jgi:glutathione S-transferase